MLISAQTKMITKLFANSLSARNRSPQTVKSYLESMRMLTEYLTENELAGAEDLSEVTPPDILAFLSFQIQKNSAATAAVRFRSLRVFYAWLVDEGLVNSSPMAGMKCPKVPEKTVPVIGDVALKKLLAVCEGSKDFLDLRDAALIRFMCEAGGARRSEVANMSVDDVAFDAEEISVIGKGSKPRAIPYGPKTAKAITMYLRARNKHPMVRRFPDTLWLAQKGPLTDNGISQMLERRCKAAGIPKIHPHALRHTAAHNWLKVTGGDEVSAMRLFGWSSRQMVARYGASQADERAKTQAHRWNIGDRL